MPVRKKSVKSKTDAEKAKNAKTAMERATLLRDIWGKRKVTRLNLICNPNFCGVFTVREFLAVVLADAHSFPRGLDTWLSIGDFEGNFCTNVLSVSLGGSASDHVCLTGDPHAPRI